MKKIVLVLSAIVLISSLALPQIARINVEPVTPHSLTTLGLTTQNSVSPGLPVFANGTYVYLSAKNVGNDDPITASTFTLLSKPGGSTATLVDVGSAGWKGLLADVKGAYKIELSITTAGGNDLDTLTVYAGDYIGVGAVDGVAGAFPSCMSCHTGQPKIDDIYSRWSTSGHAMIFREQIDIDSAASHYSTSCMKCHTTGYDHNITASNNGFDDVAASLGWVYPGHTNPGMWNNIKTNYPGLVKLAVIGCENCHGAASNHPATQAGSQFLTLSTYRAGSCAQCHDEPWRHNIYSMYENSLHSEAVWERTTGSSANTNNLGDCIRCHDGKGFVNFTKGLATDARTWTELANGTPITCATCHDPHGNSNIASLRSTPVGSDTLANGFSYTGIGGTGRTCMNCHKARSNGNTAVLANVSQRLGPHSSPQTDVLLGKNAIQFGSAYASTSHISALENACVDCHMVATTDTGTVTRDKVGGHSWNLNYNGYDHTAACTQCHGPKTSFEDFVALMDYDGDGVVEPISGELEGLLTLVAKRIPPYDIDSISWTDIRASSDSVLLKKAWWNYQLIANGGASGMHNAKFSIDVLTKTYAALGGVVPVELLGFTAEMSNGLVALNWETATETNNRGFEIQRKTGNYSWQTIGFVSGKGTTAQMSNYSYSDNPVGITNLAKITYRLKQLDFDGKANYSKEINVEYTGAPKTFSLDQNYPNPFNPETVIRYAVPTESKVKVIVYNLTGEVVKELVNEVQSAGFHESTFNTNSGINLSSGIYFYSIEATPLNGNNSFRQTKKMILLK